jgi:hypothetical protein
MSRYIYKGRGFSPVYVCNALSRRPALSLPLAGRPCPPRRRAVLAHGLWTTARKQPGGIAGAATGHGEVAASGPLAHGGTTSPRDWRVSFREVGMSSELLWWGSRISCRGVAQPRRHGRSAWHRLAVVDRCCTHATCSVRECGGKLHGIGEGFRQMAAEPPER